MEYALHGLDLAVQRHDEARRQRDLRLAYVSATEAAWWVCACDEQMKGGKPPTPYTVARDADADGCVVEGLRWVRDRNTHQLPITTGEDDRGYFDPPDGTIYGYLASDDYVWRRIEYVRTSAGHDARWPDRRQAYAEHVSERDTLDVLRRAQRWLLNAASGMTSA